jgi:phage terminase large subunit-like protein
LQTSDFCAKAKKYEDDVLSGKIPACIFVKQAIRRQRDDLKRWSREDSPFYFDQAEGNRVCRFIEYLPHTKGALRGQKIKLEPWQCWILTTIFGWRRRSDNRRRFGRVYIEVPRGNGKSSLSSGVALYCLLADREPGAEVYSFATTRDQAGIVFGDAKQMAMMSEPLRKKFGLEVLAKALFVPGTNSTFQAKSAEGSTLDGLNTHFACIDELHAHKTRAVYDVVETSIGKRLNPILWVITTAGFDTAGICYEVRTMVREVLAKTVEDETQFGIIYTIDEGDDWKTEAALIKANPNWGVSVMPKMVLPLQLKAITLASAANNFKTKHLDVWCQAGAAWMDMTAWHKGERVVDLDDFEGRPCVIGLDLGAKNDLTAKVYVFKTEGDDGRPRYQVFSRLYLPQTAIDKGTVSQYSGWADTGVIQVTGGAMTDMTRIEEELREDLSRFDVQAIAYDPWQATQLAGNLSEDGAPMVEYRNTVQNVSEPMKWLEALVQDGRLDHDGNPAMTWMMGNVVAKVDAKDNIFPRKERYESKIDGPVALIYALAMYLSDREDTGGDFDEFLDDIIVI